MTVSSLGQSQLIRAEVARLREQINTLQQQVTSGQKAGRYGDLGSLAPLDISLRNQGEQIDSFKNGISFLQIRAGVIDQNLTNIRDTALQVRDLTIKNLGFDAGRSNIISAAQDAVTSITQKLQVNVDGRFLFAGVATDAAPMVNDSTLLAQVRSAINTALTASPAPTDIPAAIQSAVAGVFATQSNYYTGGALTAPTEVDNGLTVDLGVTGNDPAFKTMLQGLYTIAALDMPVDDPATLPAIGRADFDATVRAAAVQVDSGASQVADLITRNGRSQAELDDADKAHDRMLTLIQGQIDDIEQVDLADASARITQLRTQLQASFQLTAQLQNLSLVNFLT